MSLPLRAGAWCVCVLFATAASAHELSPDGGVVHTETVVRAARPMVSAAETVVPQDVVKAAPRVSAVDLLRLVPGLVATQHSGAGKAHQLFLRGFDAVHGQDVELNVAGLPVNEVSHIHALGYADVNWLIPEAVREVRVFEGPHRAFQGDFAIAGTVRFELAIPDDGFGAGISIDSLGGRRALFTLRPDANQGTFLALELGDSPGFGARRASQRFNLLGQGSHQLGPLKLRAVVGSYVTRFESPGVLREADLLAGRTGFYDAVLGHQGGSASRHQLLLGAELQHTRGRSLVEAYGVLNALLLRNNFTGFRGDAAGDGLEQTQDTVFFGARAEHHQHFEVFGVPLFAEGALGFRHDRVRQGQSSYRESDGARVRREVDARFSQTDTFLYAELSSALRGWKPMLGFRADVLTYDVFDQLVENGAGYQRAAGGVRVGLKAGLARELGEHAQLFLNYGDGFRSPQARSLAGGERAPFVGVRSGDLGAAWASPRLKAQVTGFASWV